MKYRKPWAFALSCTVLLLIFALSACSRNAQTESVISDSACSRNTHTENVIADDENVDGIEYRAEDDFAWVAGYDGNAAEIVIASEYKGKPVTRIGESAFQFCAELKSITIPDSVTEISDEAFYGASLESVTIPGSVEKIGEYAFWDCHYLKSVTILDGVKEIGKCSFAACNALESVIVPNSVSVMGDSAFGFCSSLRYIELSENIKDLGENVFTWECMENPEIMERFHHSDSDMVCTLYEGVTVGRLEVVPTMTSISSGSVQVENISENTLVVLIPAGTYLESVSQNVQNMLITNPRWTIIGAGQTETLYCDSACMNLHRDIPIDSDGYTVGEVETNSVLEKLVEVIQEQEIEDYAVRQAAVWIVTDDASYEDTGILRNGFTMVSLISEENYERAQELVNEACSRQQ